jgi:hypothetical protein
MDLEAIRMELHDAVDKILDDYQLGDGARPQSIAQPPPTTETPVVTWGKLVPDWSYTWPGDEGTEPFDQTRRFKVTDPYKEYDGLLAWGKRPSWGRNDRKRAIVFGQVGPNSFYPWTEFAETDTGFFAAPIPNPEHPRKILTQSDPLPGRYRGAHVERTDQLFDQITNGPSLRLVVTPSDDEDMVRHGYWVARLRNRL